MSQQRGWLDRFFGGFVPRRVPEFAPPPRELADGLFSIDRLLRLPGGVAIPTRSVAVRLADGGIVLLAPPHLDPKTREAVSNLGPIRALVAPNSFHYLGLDPWVATFPGAEVYLAPGLDRRRPELPPGRPLAPSPPPLWAGQLDQAVFGPQRGVSEVAFLHRASRSLLLTDLVFNIRGETDARSRFVWRLYGSWERFGPSRSVRWVLIRGGSSQFSDFLGEIRAWDFDRIVMAHGDVVETGGQAKFAAAFRDY